MMSINEYNTALDALYPELVKAFRDVPAYGEIGFHVRFHKGQPVRIEYSTALLQSLNMNKGQE